MVYITMVFYKTEYGQIFEHIGDHLEYRNDNGNDNKNNRNVLEVVICNVVAYINSGHIKCYKDVADELLALQTGKEHEEYCSRNKSSVAADGYTVTKIILRAKNMTQYYVFDFSSGSIEKAESNMVIESIDITILQTSNLGPIDICPFGSEILIDGPIDYTSRYVYIDPVGQFMFTNYSGLEVSIGCHYEIYDFSPVIAVTENSQN